MEEWYGRGGVCLRSSPREFLHDSLNGPRCLCAVGCEDCRGCRQQVSRLHTFKFVRLTRRSIPVFGWNFCHVEQDPAIPQEFMFANWFRRIQDVEKEAQECNIAQLIPASLRCQSVWVCTGWLRWSSASLGLVVFIPSTNVPASANGTPR